MPTPIRILHLEDSPRDAELIREKMAAAGLVCDIVCVDSRERFAAALAGRPFDVILCDYHVPGFNGFSALQMAQEKQPGAPVMLTTGSIDEAEAVKCLQHGATDYLLKQRLDRLPAAVTRALTEVEEQRRRQQAEQLLRESEERFRQLAEHSSDGFWFVALTPQERLVYVSPAVEKIWGLPAERFYQDTGTWLAAVHSADRARVDAAWEVCRQGRSPRFDAEYRVIRPDGSQRWVLDSGTPICDAAGAIVRVSGVVRDITERKQSEAQLLRSQRLESIGTLAGGVAHDINNALAPILMVAELLRTQLPAESELFDTLEGGAKRAADMVRQLLTFAKGVEGERLLVQPRHLLKEMEKIIRGSFPKNIQLRTHYAPELRTVLGDATQLHQVLLNLCVNARDAMPNGGTLTLVAENADIDAAFASGAPEARPGRYVVWRVTDTGTGIPSEILERIFEPFFTTKGPDKGTGLGLSTVSGIVRSHGGFLRVYSVMNQGTTFTVYLPVDAADTAAAAAPAAPLPAALRGQGETILVVDDEADIRAVLRDLLTRLNFKVLTAGDGTEALIQVAEHRTELRVVITDLHMPHMDGLAFVRVLKRMLPGAGIIVVSGRMEERAEREFQTLGVAALLDKPFTRDALVAALKSVFVK